MKAAILQISEGSDIIRCIVVFATNNQKGVTVMSAYGSVRDVTLSQPKLSLPGPFHMLSLTGAVNASGSFFGDFAVTLAGEQGQLFGGTFAGKLVVASDMVVAVATTFDRPTVCSLLLDRIILEKEEEDEEEEDEEEDEDEEEEDEDEEEEEGLTDNE